VSDGRAGAPSYPISFTVDVDDHDRNRLTYAFRLILAIPILALAAAVGQRMPVNDSWIAPTAMSRSRDRHAR